MSSVVSRATRASDRPARVDSYRDAIATRSANAGTSSRPPLCRADGIVALLIVFVASSAVAQEPEPRWAFAVTPYLCAAGIPGVSGTLAGLPTADVDEPFGASVLEDRAREH